MVLILGETEKEKIRGVETNILKNEDILLFSLVSKLKSIGYPLENGRISYFSPLEKIYIMCGNEPLPKNKVIPFQEYSGSPSITLKVKNGGSSTGFTNQQTYMGGLPEMPANKASRRTKERKIGFIIEKVSMWRKLYNGIQDNNGNIIRYTLEDAAQQVRGLNL